MRAHPSRLVIGIAAAAALLCLAGAPSPAGAQTNFCDQAGQALCYYYNDNYDTSGGVVNAYGANPCYSSTCNPVPNGCCDQCGCTQCLKDHARSVRNFNPSASRIFYAENYDRSQGFLCLRTGFSATGSGGMACIPPSGDVGACPGGTVYLHNRSHDFGFFTLCHN